MTLEPGEQHSLPAALFQRADETPDEAFYASPRFVEHIDPETIGALTEFYREFLPQDADVLDLMSSWISHYPDELPLGRVAGLGMNAEELSANPRLTDFCVHNLNTEPTLPYTEDSFSHMTLAVSIQYLIRPIEVMKSAWNVLKVNGAICIAMSHRLFPTKAVMAFHRLSATERIKLVSLYLEQAGFVDVNFLDRSPPQGDPLWLVIGSKKAST